MAVPWRLVLGAGLALARILYGLSAVLDSWACAVEDRCRRREDGEGGGG